MSWTAVLRSIGYYTVYPAVVTGPLVLSLLRVLAAPLLHVLTALAWIILFPLRILVNLESFYVFFGVATLLGFSAGFALHYSLRYSFRLLNLDPSVQAKRRTRQDREQLAKEADDRMKLYEIDTPRDSDDAVSVEDSVENWRRAVTKLKYEMANRRGQVGPTIPEDGILKLGGGYYNGAKAGYRRRWI